MRHELASDVEDAFSELPPQLTELLDREAIRGIWNRHLDGQASWLQPWALFSLVRWTRTLPA
jgi:hypothetical protein